MKTNSSCQQENGSVLLVTLVITAILGFALASYLTLIGAQNRSVARSQNWNSAIPISEAGIEEAIVHLNANCLWNPITSAPVDWQADGWTAVPDGIQKVRWLNDAKYEVTIITNAPYSTNAPGIFSKGFVPALVAGRSPSAVLATVGVAADTQQQPILIGRQVRVTTGKDGFMTRAMVAKNTIDLKGNNIETDSFDSENPAYSTGGLYDPAKRKDNGDVAVNNGLEDSLNLGNAEIYGSVAVGPGGTIAIGNGKVGDAAWIADPSTSGIQPGRSRDDMNVSFPDVELPFTNGFSTPLLNQVVTNDVIVVSNIITVHSTYPTNSGTVQTNASAQTTTTYPISGTYIGSVITNTTPTVSAGLPAAGTYVGVVATNTVTTTTVSHPAAGSYLGTVITNAPYFTTTTYPSNPYGPVTINYKGSSGNIRDYTYRKITGYTYERIDGYLYNRITGYTVAHITGYNLVQSIFTTNRVVETYDYVFDSGNYRVSTIDGKVLIRGDAVVHITDDVDMTGSSEDLQINSGARLRLYMGGSSFKLAGQGKINDNGNADNFWYFGLPSNTDIKFSGNAAFTGVIYAPQAALQLGGGGSDTWDFIGATLTKSVQMNGHFRFHYDEALSRKGPSRGYIISGWDEIKLTDAYNSP